VSGEEAIEVDSGDTLTNPTLFEASPLLEVEGYGTIDVNWTEIEINNDPIGDVTIASDINESKRTVNISFPEVYLMPGDLIEVYNTAVNVVYKKYSGNHSLASATLISYSGDTGAVPVVTYTALTFTRSVVFTSPLQFYYGISSEKNIRTRIEIVTNTGGSPSAYLDFYVYVRYDGEKTIQFYIPTPSITVGNPGATDTFSYEKSSVLADSIVAHSTATTFGHPTYIDCDLGEAYADDNGVISSLNSYIELGSKLPKLSVGSSEITFDNTITDLKVTPRWWRV
jgi:phage-related protein